MQTTEDIRASLIGSFKDLKESKITPTSANALANLAGKINKTIDIEHAYYRLVGESPKGKINYIKGASK